MKKIFFLVITFLGISFYGFSQISYELATIVPSSPSVDGFKKFTDFPVDKHTGLPTINYGIYNFSVDGIDVGISLSYHASGIRVDERASTVGIGWNLLTGGVINREVRGLPDDIDMGYFADGGAYNDVNRFFSLVSQYGNDYYNPFSG